MALVATDILNAPSSRRQNTPLFQRPNCLHAKRFLSCKITSTATLIFYVSWHGRTKTNFLHVRPSVLMLRPISYWTGYSEICIGDVRKYLEIFHWFKIGKEYRGLYIKPKNFLSLNDDINKHTISVCSISGINYVILAEYV